MQEVSVLPVQKECGFMEQEIRKENKMGVQPIGKLLFGMSLPMILSMLIQALYNVVDSIYVSQISENALTAVSLVFPMQSLMISVATGTGVGINALLSRNLGAKRFKDANKVARHAIFLAACSFIAVAIVMFFAAKPFMGVQTSDPEIYEGGVIYMRICCCASLGLFGAVTMERLLTSTGLTMFTMITQTTGAVFNIIMDPILIFGYGPFPKMGVAGAALATVSGQCIGCILGLIFNLKKNKEISLKLKGFRPDPMLIGEIYRIAVPSIIMASIGSVMTFGFNMILMQYLKNSTAAAVFGVYFKLQSMIFMPLFGLNNGMVPIIAYNYGAEHRGRIMKTYRLAMFTSFALMLIGILAMWIIPDKLLLLFNASENMLGIGVPALRIISLSYIFAGYCIVTGSVMQALGRAFYSMINSITRQLVFLLPSAFLLAAAFRSTGGLPQVWYSYDLAEIASFVVTLYFFRKVYREVIAPLPE